MCLGPKRGSKWVHMGPSGRWPILVMLCGAQRAALQSPLRLSKVNVMCYNGLNVVFLCVYGQKGVQMGPYASGWYYLSSPLSPYKVIPIEGIIMGPRKCKVNVT